MYLAKKVIIPEYARKFAVVEHEAVRSSRNDAGLWLGHVRNVMFGAPRLVSLALDWVFRRHLTYRSIPSVALPNAAGVNSRDFNGEQPQNPESRVLLAHETDRYDVPKLKVDWRVSELDWLTLTGMRRELRRAV
jgi:hypothetical protein